MEDSGLDEIVLTTVGDERLGEITQGINDLTHMALDVPCERGAMDVVAEEMQCVDEFGDVLCELGDDGHGWRVGWAGRFEREREFVCLVVDEREEGVNVGEDALAGLDVGAGDGRALLAEGGERVECALLVGGHVGMMT